jgi:hypothetical protein
MPLPGLVIVIVIVVMGVNGEGRILGLAKELEISGVTADTIRVTVTADMVIEADHGIGGCHHQVQVVGYHDNATIEAVSQFHDKLVEPGLPCDIDALNRFVQYQ